MGKVSKYIVLIKERLYDLNNQVHVMYDQAIAQTKTRSNNQPIMNRPFNSSGFVGPQKSLSKSLNFIPSKANGTISPSINYVPLLTTLPVTSIPTVRIPTPSMPTRAYSTNSGNFMKAQTSLYLPTSRTTTTNYASYSTSSSSAPYPDKTTKNQTLTAAPTTPASYFVDWAHRFNPWG